MEAQHVQQLLEIQRQSLMSMFEKERYELLDKYIKLQIEYNQMKVDRDILSRNYNKLVNQLCPEDAT